MVKNVSENDEIINWLDKNKDKFAQISDKIWEFAEPRFEEVKSAKLQIETLKEEGFTVTQGVADMPTAFIGSYGTEGSCDRRDVFTLQELTRETLYMLVV